VRLGQRRGLHGSPFFARDFAWGVDAGCVAYRIVASDAAILAESGNGARAFGFVLADAFGSAGKLAFHAWRQQVSVARKLAGVFVRGYNGPDPDTRLYLASSYSR